MKTAEGSPANDSHAESQAGREPVDEAERYAFGRLTEEFRREIRLHCYRMVGSLHEADDLVQETFLRAWRARATHEGRAPIRAWMYQIATNACLDALRNRVAVRKLFAHAGPPAPSDASIGAPPNASWLEPYPDSEMEIPDGAIGPEASYERVETVRLAFLAAVQQLAPRQRAVFLLREAMGWSAEQVAEAIHATPLAVNSLLQRARRVFAEQHAPLDAPPSSTSEQEAIAARYAAAWEARNLDAFAALLCEDAIWRMPPFAQWFRGRDAIRAFFARVWPGYSAFKVVGLRANGQPACAVYDLEPTAHEWRAHSIHVLDFAERRISAINGYVGSLGLALFSYFDLPMLINDV